MMSVAQQFNVGKPKVHDIVKNEAKVKRFATEIEGNCIKKRKIVRRPEFSDLIDQAVYLWLSSNGTKVCSNIVNL